MQVLWETIHFIIWLLNTVLASEILMPKVRLCFKDGTGLVMSVLIYINQKFC
jgi:hypothetical protein